MHFRVGLSAILIVPCLLEVAPASACTIIRYCDKRKPPPCEVRCVNFSIVNAGSRYKVVIEGIPPEDVAAVLDQLKISRGSVSTSGSRIELPARSKGSITGILDKLNVEKGAVTVPQ